MTVYVIAEIEVTDDSWIPEYAEKVHDIVHKHDGKYLARSANIENLEGESLPTTLIAIIEFPVQSRPRPLLPAQNTHHSAVPGKRVQIAGFA